MDVFGGLRKLLGMDGGQQPRQNQPRNIPASGVPSPRRTNYGVPQDNMTDTPQGYVPDITYNPNPNKNIPYSTNNRADVALGNEYTRDPMNPKFLGVDPARFGYPADVAPYSPPKLYTPSFGEVLKRTRF